MAENIKNGITKVLIANVINLIIGLLSSFILPKYLSVNTYADIKTYQLYISYIGLLHFGYVDSLYLLYGGKKLDDINLKSLKENLSTFQIFELLVTFICIIISVFFENNLLLFFSLSIIPANMLSFYQCIYQAVGEFSLYGKIINSTTISYFVLNMILIFILKKDVSLYYIFVIFFVNCCICIILKINAWKKRKLKFEFKYFKPKLIWYNIKNGILLTLGNLSSILLTGMDRWFVKFFMNSIAFAQYSFAVSIENFLEVLVSAITITMYNYFCKVTDIKKIRSARNMIMFFSAIIVASAFPARLFLEIFLNKYIGSSNVMFILFGAQIFYIIIKGIYINLYKARRKQTIYFIKLICVILLGFAFNIICYSLCSIKESFAIGTLISSICWYFMCIKDFKEIYYSKKEFIYPLIESVIYLICGIFFNPIIGFVLYMLLTLILTLLLIPNVIVQVKELLSQNIKRVLLKK